MLFSRPSKAIGVDIGTHSVKAVAMSRSGGRLTIDRVGFCLIDRNQFNVDPIVAQAKALREALDLFPISSSLLVASLPGQSVVIRHPRHRELAKAELNQAIRSDASQNLPYELSEVFLDWCPVETIEEGGENYVKVVLVAARHEAIDTRVQIMEAAGLQCSILGVDSLALADAAEACDFLRVGETVALVNLGASNTNIHFTKDGVSNFIRDVSWGAKELIQAIAKSRRCDFAEAERLLRDYDEASVATQPEPAFEAPPAQGSSLLDPLEDELGALGDVGGKDVTSAHTSVPESSMDDMLHAPLTRLVGEIRRSFDFYEQQLYEKPVERILLSGGVAHLPQLRAHLHEELGVEEISVADPTDSALSMGAIGAMAPMKTHPPQFLVSVGLAVRGMADV